MAEIEASRILDGKIEELVMQGEGTWEQFSDGEWEHGFTDEEAWIETPEYSTEWKDAGLVVGRMRELGWRVALSEDKRGRWWASFMSAWDVMVTVDAETPQAAVCLAALAVKEGTSGG